MSESSSAECPGCGSELVGGWFGALTRAKRCPDCGWSPDEAPESALRRT
jgi:endogenous inhibitor of DNA gyrase (YacG/DUF329 family)